MSEVKYPTPQKTIDKIKLKNGTMESKHENLFLSNHGVATECPRILPENHR